MPLYTRFFAILFTLITVSSAQPGSEDLLQTWAHDYFAKQPQAGLPQGISYDTALTIQDHYLQKLTPELGPKVGYKVGLVTPAGQKRYGIDHPVRGVLLQKMLHPNGSKVSARYGTQPILEADLIVRVKDEGINEAKTLEDAARHLSSVVAFIELADTTVATNPPIDFGTLVASNVGARSGILGEERKVEATESFIRAFGKMRIVLKKDGTELSRVSADGILGHPLNAVLWLVKDMNAKGAKLKAGDLLSLGSPSPQVSPKPNENYTLIYEGLPGGDLHATVSLE